jgi:E3 ubiquitin-protein ligase UBR1
MRGTLLDRISPQALTHLRIYSETVSSYISVGGLRHSHANHTLKEVSRKRFEHLHQLFIGHPKIFESDSLPYELKDVPSLLSQDPFIFLCEVSMFAGPELNQDIHHLLRLCYLAELVRVAITFAVDRPGLFDEYGTDRFINTEKVSRDTFTPDQLDSLLKFVGIVLNIPNLGHSAAPHDFNNMPIPDKFRDPKFLYSFFTLASTYALPFVRKAALLMHVRYGVEFPPVAFERVDEPELDRLSLLLKLPSLHEMFASLSSDAVVGHTTRSIVGGWLRHYLWTREGHYNPSSITLSHPSIFELVGLPKNYDTLTDEAIRRRCPSTGRELTDPALCLLCGEIMCSQGVCCMTSASRGGCNQHQAKCGGNIGLFIHIRKCMVLFLNEEHGTWYTAPYLDKHGETDPTLRRHHQLFLNQKRYDVLLRKVWLEGGVQSFIARRLEGDINNGGWETL